MFGGRHIQLKYTAFISTVEYVGILDSFRLFARRILDCGRGVAVAATAYAVAAAAAAAGQLAAAASPDAACAALSCQRWLA